ncbi:MAG: outer membrane beta-barrel protein [Prevotellaceae bacterium]|nr:outer membrane beta-barrel protein [Prevotellaceae bacterium]
MYKILLLFLCLSGVAVSAAAQSPTATVRGSVRDSATTALLEFATVALQTRDGRTVGYTTTGADGRFEIRDVAAGSYVLSVSFVGYATLTRSVRVAGATLDVGAIRLSSDAVRLGEVVVSGVGNAMIIKKDTIEYNAASYRVTEGAVLEELVKKLDGAEVDSDGKITVNGKEVTKVLLDGKTFFSDDPQIAMKNLPANIVDRVQVIDRKSEQAQFTGIDDGNEETVLNLTVRPGMKNGWFGNASAGAGYENRYQAGGLLSNIKDDRQLSLLASGNNTNNRGFFDFTGNMMQQGRGGGSSIGGIGIGGGGGGSQGGMNMNVGGSRMSIGGNGITTSWLGGLNAYDEFGDRLKATGNYFYNGADTRLNRDSYRQNLFGNDSSSYYNQQTQSLSTTQGHRAATELEWTIDSLNSIIFKPNINYGAGRFDETSQYTTLAAGLDTVNDGMSRAAGDNTSLAFTGDLLYRHKFRTAGRTFSANVVLGYSSNVTDGSNYSLTRVAGLQGRTDAIDQQFRTDNMTYSVNTRLSYTEPLGRNYFAEIAYGARISRNTSDKQTFDVDPNGEYTLLDSAYSNQYRNLFVNQRAEVNIQRVHEKYNWTLGLQAQPTYLRSEREGEPSLSRNAVNFSPIGNFVYYITDHQQFRVNYRGNTSEPSISQLQPVPDNSNPLLERLGNPDLNPEFAHNLRLMYRSTDLQTFRTIMTSLNASITNNKIVNTTIYESTTGKQLIVPVNAGGVYALRSFLMLTTPFRRGSPFSIMSNTSVNYTQNVSLSRTVADLSAISHRPDDLLAGSDQNTTRSLSVNEMLRLGYKGDKIDINLMARAGYSRAWYSLDNRDQPTYWNNNVGGDFNWSLPWDLSLASDLNYSFYIGYPEGYNQPTCVWNAEISKLLFRQKQGTLKVRIFDLLNEGRGITHTTTDNYIEDVSVNTLGRYVMLSFTYRFGSFGNSNDRGNRSNPPPGGMFPRPR